MTKRLYDANGRWVELDARHLIAREWTGSATKIWAFRFCDDFVSSHETKASATAAALRWEMARVDRMLA